MKALVYERSVRRYVAANIAGRLGRPTYGGGPVRLKDFKTPTAPTPSWVAVTPLLSGICGSDLQAVAGRTSGYFEQLVSFPFVLGHEVVGKLEDSSRVVIEPALGCEARGIVHLCPSCASGHIGTCYNVVAGDIKAGPQTGYCSSTGGGWSSALMAHPTQLHAIPETMTDEDAVLVEPLACAVHAVTAKAHTEGADVAVIGAGTLGLLVTAALSQLATPKSVTVAAKHPHQKVWARTLGAGSVVSPAELVRAVRSRDQTFLYSKTALSAERVAGGVDVVFDCVGSSSSIAQALSITKPGGRIVLVGMPGNVAIDASALWHREIELVGAYCYSRSAQHSDFATAIKLAEDLNIGRLVSAHFPLSQWNEALAHAANAGRLGSTKVVFDLRTVANV